MAGQFTIELKGLRFFAEHGLYPEEQRTGNEFEVDVTLTYQAPEKPVVSIEETVNYAEVYRIVKNVFLEPRQLLETCALQIANQLQGQFSQIEQLTVSIRKLHPPIVGFTGMVGVSYTEVKSQK